MHRPTMMTRATTLIGAILAGGLVLGVLSFGGAKAQTAQAQTSNPAPAGNAPAGQTAASPSQAAPAPSQRNAPAASPERRRRTSYAACNRQSHNRGLKGGARRRFLVRCKLGYERARAAPTQPSVRQP